VHREPLWGSVYSALKASIQSLEYLPGEPVSETELAEKFKVSRTPVREALYRLKAEGFLTKRPGSSPRIAKVTIDQAIAAASLRCLLEPYAVWLAASRLGRGDLAEASRLLDERDRYVTSKGSHALSPHDYLTLEREAQGFHSVLVAASGERLLISIIDEHLWPSWFGAYGTLTPDWLDRSSVEHRSILESVIARDADRAESEMRTHLYAGLENLRHVSKPASVGPGRVSIPGAIARVQGAPPAAAASPQEGGPGRSRQAAGRQQVPSRRAPNRV